MDELQEAIHSVDPLPESVHRHTSELTNVKITTTIASITPGGKPDPHKPNDSIQANMVSRICAIKQDEHQIPGHKPAILVMDFANFGGPHIAEMSDTCAASPVQSFRGDITCGHFWYALYGYKGAPLFEAGHRPLVHMQHDGRYRLKCKQKSKLSAVLLVMPKASILLENPWPKRRLPERARILLIQYPWFDLTRSIGDWKKGNAAMQIKLHRKLISAMEKHCPEFWEP